MDNKMIVKGTETKVFYCLSVFYLQIFTFLHNVFTQNNPSYEATDAQDWTQERDRQQTSYINNDGQSLEGYKKAWENLSAKLEAGKDEYIYSTDNKYLENQENVEDNKDLFSQGMEFFKAGKIREAILAFEAEVKKDGSNSEGWRMLGKHISSFFFLPSSLVFLLFFIHFFTLLFDFQLTDIRIFSLFFFSSSFFLSLYPP